MTSGSNNFIDFPHQWGVNLSHGGLHPLEGVCIKATSGGCQLEPGGFTPPYGGSA